MTKTLIVYDSSFGNTEQIAQAIGKALGLQNDVKVLRVGDVEPAQLAGLGLMLVGSPTQGFRPTDAIRGFLESIPADGLANVKVAAFDARISIDDLGSPILRFLARLLPLRCAAKPISALLESRGGERVVSPEGFLVKGTRRSTERGRTRAGFGLGQADHSRGDAVSCPTVRGADRTLAAR